MVNDGVRIVLAKRHTGTGQGQRGGLPWFMEELLWKFCQFRTPTLNVVALRIKFLALSNGVEDTEIGCRISPGAGDPLPAAGI